MSETTSITPTRPYMVRALYRSEERRVGKECRSRGAPSQCT